MSAMTVAPLPHSRWALEPIDLESCPVSKALSHLTSIQIGSWVNPVMSIELLGMNKSPFGTICMHILFVTRCTMIPAMRREGLGFIVAGWNYQSSAYVDCQTIISRNCGLLS